MTRGGAKHKPDAPERRCIVTRETGGKAGMVRFVLDPDGVVTPDISEKLPGRGMWVTATEKVLSQAVKRNAFSSAAKKPAKIPEDLAEMTGALLAKRLIELISLSRKAGKAMAGFDKVKAALEYGEARILFQASDGSADQKRKLRPPKGQNVFYDQLTADELGLAFGREHVIHAALLAGGMTLPVQHAANRLVGFRADPKLAAGPAGSKG
ncbi:MAG: RNA-binding protein [Pseudomonadota bacterium]